MICLVFSTDAPGVTTETWVQTTQSDFDKGSLDRLSTHSTGEVTLSPGIETVHGIEEPYVWCMTADVYGTIYVGTGEPGTVYKISSTGNSFVKKEAVKLYRSSELHVHSIEVDSYGNIYAGTAPQGIIYRITPEGRTTILCQLPVYYIWSMAIDSRGNLYAATGDSGIIYKIDNYGRVTVLFDSPESHILAMAIDEEDNIYAGSEPNGIIYKIKADGKASVLYDAKEGEIHCLALDKDGNLYAGTAAGGKLRFPRPSPRKKRHPEAQGYPYNDSEHYVQTDDTIFNALQFNHYPANHSRKHELRYPEEITRTKGGPVGYNKVYKVTPEGNVTKVFAVKNAFIFGLAVDGDNDLYVGTGNESRIYKVTHDEDITTTLIDVKESQVLALVACGNEGVYIGTGNNGSVLRISSRCASEGTFLSSVHDARFVSKWGRISWMSSTPAGTRLTFATRTGNSSRPDSTWSNWSDEYNTSGVEVKSPHARFIQYRARLTTSNHNLSPVLHEVSVAYLTNNQPPRISGLVVDMISNKGYASKMSGQRSRNSKTNDNKNHNSRFNEHRSNYEHTVKTIYWNADDPNNDRLSFKLYYKAIDELNWKDLADGLYSTDYYSWDTSRVPDGKYQIKLAASDEPDNPPALAISTEKICHPFVIDNTRPRVAGLEATIRDTEKCSVKGIASDATCIISKIQYSLDATDWVSIFPEDQIFDAEEETFQLLTPTLSRGEHTIVVNAFDSEGNVGSSKVVVNVE